MFDYSQINYNIKVECADAPCKVGDPVINQETCILKNADIFQQLGFLVRHISRDPG
jgi:hypothetical protein